jgi:hypothetical protein
MKLRLILMMIIAAIALAGLPAQAQIYGAGGSYSWVNDYDRDNTIISRIDPPTGYTRTSCTQGSYCDWLRHLPLKAQGSPVLHFDGTVKTGAAAHAVLDLDTGTKDLQQCADAVMRLKAEYHYSKKDYDRIHFNFTSGHKVSFGDWRRGRKPIVRGNKVSFTGAREITDNSYSNFKKYMTIIFSYAGTLSLSQEMKPVSLANMKAGDVFIFGGRPGHAVLVIDIAENTSGEKMFMLAQSYMPAQDMHILTNPFHPGEGPWYSANFDEELFTPEWRFYAHELKRFRF